MSNKPLQSEHMHPHNELPPKITKETITALNKSAKNQCYSWIKLVLYLLISSFLVSFAAYALITPNDFTVGGVSGIAILIHVASGGVIPQSTLVVAINAPLVILSFFLVKKRFALISTANICLQSLWLLLIEQCFADFRIIFPGGEASKIFAALGAGLCFGTAISFAFKIGGSTGGTDILAVLIQKKVAANSISWLLFAINFTIISSSLFVFPKQLDANGALDYGATLLPIAIATIETYIESKTTETMMNGLQSAREFRIITSKPELMSSILMHELRRGVTGISVTGMYTHEDKTMISCIVSRRQVASLKRIIKAVDPDSFAIMYNVSQVIGLGFYSEDA